MVRFPGSSICSATSFLQVLRQVLHMAAEIGFNYTVWNKAKSQQHYLHTHAQHNIHICIQTWAHTKRPGVSRPDGPYSQCAADLCVKSERHFPVTTQFHLLWQKWRRVVDELGFWSTPSLEIFYKVCWDANSLVEVFSWIRSWQHSGHIRRKADSYSRVVD